MTCRKIIARLCEAVGPAARPDPGPPPVVVCERCGLRRQGACWHRLCPLPTDAGRSA